MSIDQRPPSVVINSLAWYGRDIEGQASGMKSPRGCSFAVSARMKMPTMTILIGRRGVNDTTACWLLRSNHMHVRSKAPRRPGISQKY